MSLFFFVSAYFVPASYSRRGGRPFVRGRLLRLGVPVPAGALTLVPGLMYAYYVHYRGYPEISFPRYFADVYLGLGERPGDWSGPSWPDLQFGHLWFFQNLLAYSLLYALCPWWPAPSAAPPPPPRASFHRAGCPDTSRSRPSPWCSERGRGGTPGSAGPWRPAPSRCTSSTYRSWWPSSSPWRAMDSRRSARSHSSRPARCRSASRPPMCCAGYRGSAGFCEPVRPAGTYSGVAASSATKSAKAAFNEDSVDRAVPTAATNAAIPVGV